jgi:methionyl-tRNA formyltransferase
MIRVVFFGTSLFSLPTLEALAKEQGFSVVGVVTQPDRPVGRHGVITAPPVKTTAQKLNLPVFQFEQVKSDEAYEVLKTLQADVAVVASFGQIISQRVLDLYPRGVVNVHPSLLPAYRGAIPMTAAIRDGLTHTGITIMLMDALMDHGAILSQVNAEILPTDTSETLSARLAVTSAQLLVETLKSFLEGKIQPQAQNHAAATFVKLLSREDGKLDLSKSATEIERLVRAYTPWPGTSLDYKGKRLKVLRAHVASELKSTELTIECGEKSMLVLDEVQPEGKTPMSGEAFLRGTR